MFYVWTNSGEIVRANIDSLALRLKFGYPWFDTIKFICV